MTDTTVLIVGDQPLMLRALQTFIENGDDVSVTGTAENEEVAVEVTKSLQPDLILMDIKMPRFNGIEATRRIIPEIPGTRVLVLTTFSTLNYVVPTLRIGAAGYLVKDARLGEILAAIRNAMDDSLPLSSSVVRSMTRRVVGDTPDIQAAIGAAATEVGPAPREISVLQFSGNGLSNRKIAGKMYILEGSVKTYLANVYTRLGVRDRLQAVIRGFELDIVSPRLSADE